MNSQAAFREADLHKRVKWLIFFRLLFSSLLLGSTIIFQLGQIPSPASRSLLILYGLIVAIFMLTCAYALLLRRGIAGERVVTLQAVLDTFFVTTIIAVTGGYASIFNFLYLLVIIYTSIMLPRRNTVIVAALCCIQYGVMVDFEYFGLFDLFRHTAGQLAPSQDWREVLYKIVITMIACLAVAILSSFLSEQTRSTRRELNAMEEHVKRVERMAAIGELAAGLAHEIKNPLASLSGAIQLLKEDMRRDPDHDRLMHIILREADRLSSLVTNFLMYARPPMGKTRPIEVQKAIKDTTELFQKDSANGRRIETILDVAPGLWIEIDPVHLRQILWNLLLNAAESIEKEGRIVIQAYSAKNKTVRIHIQDNGCGINPETLQSIFDPFFTTKANGTGLGLSIVHRILDHYNAWLDVTSTQAQGSVFTINFRQFFPQN